VTHWELAEWEDRLRQISAGGPYDAVLLIGALDEVYDVSAAVRCVFAALAPRGILLATVAGIEAMRGDDACDRYWSFTSLAMQRIFEEVFPPPAVSTVSYGNVLAAAALLHRLSPSELDPAKLDAVDPDYEVVIGVRAQRPEGVV
jgi:hypothetical protein